MAQPLLNVTELDFDQIKANLKAYFLRQDSPIKDWNFDGSGLNMLLDVLAYNTHYNAILAHLNLNESFIDTAQLRSSVISQAKLLGYIPRSITAPRATVSVSLTPSGSPTAASSIIIPSYTKFTGSLPDASFTFVNQEASNPINFNTVSGTYTASFDIIQGVLRNQTYQVDNSIPNQKYIIDDPSADINTLLVGVYQDQNLGTPTYYTPITGYTTLSDVTPTTQVYYLAMNSQGKYEVSFGDDVTGTSLNNLNVVQLSYISTQGAIANNITTFELADSLRDQSNNAITTAVVTTLTNSYSGADEESIDSIRLNAPASLIAQNRAVTANDYIAILKQKFPAITAVNVWGGEDEVTFDPINAAQYAGKVYICAYPTQDETELLDTIKPYKVMSITPIVYDSDFINLYLNVNLKYSPNLTNKSSTELSSLISSTSGGVISNYNNASLLSFTGVFRHSNLLRQIDNADPAILNSDIQVSFYKDYTVNPFTGPLDVASSTIGIQAIPNALITTFGNKLFGAVNQVNSMVSSDGISIASVTLPSQQIPTVTATYSGTSNTVTIISSPGAGALTTNNLSNPYITVGATVTGSSFSTSTIVSINNTGSNTIITVSTYASSSTTGVNGNTLYITPRTGSGTFYLRDGADPTTTSTRRLFLSTLSASLVAIDPKYTSTGSDIHIGTVYPATGKIELYRYILGQATSQPVVGLSLTDSLAASVGTWSTNQFAGCTLFISAGTGIGTSMTITTNSGNTVYWSTPSTVIDSTSQYVIIRSSIDSTAISAIKIYSRPASNDVAPSRHQLLQINSQMTNVTATADSFAQAGVLGASSYTTFSRDPQS